MEGTSNTITMDSTEREDTRSSSRSDSEYELPLPEQNVRAARQRRNSQVSARPKNPTRWQGLWYRLTEPIRPSGFAELQLILLTFCTGIQDAISFPDYHCFASNQTGNTIFLTLALVLPQLNGEMFITANIGMALGLFLGAGWLTGQLSHVIGPRCRLWLIFCNFVQTALVFGAGAIQYRHGVELQGGSTLAVIGLLAFAAGSQVVQSRSLAMTEISTAMATAALVDLVIDPNILGLKNRPRNRRVMFLLALVVGSLFGALIWKRVGSPAAIMVSAAGKMLVTIMYFFTPAEKPKKPQAGEA